MEKKDLAREYATARLQGRLSGNEISFCENKVFTEGDIETAFNAGRKSIVENIPNLEWVDFGNDMWGANIPFAHIIVMLDDSDRKYHIRRNGYSITTKVFATDSQAKSYANDEYKEQLKHALGL